MSNVVALRPNRPFVVEDDSGHRWAYNPEHGRTECVCCGQPRDLQSKDEKPCDKRLLHAH